VPVYDFEKQKRMREFIALLDQAIEMGKDLNRQIDAIGEILEEKYPEKLAA
jgi:hypothetical protein